MTPNAQPREEWREAYDATGLSERIQSVELFAINHGFKEWDGITIPAFIESILSSQRAELAEKIRKMYPILYSEDVYQHNRNISRHNTLDEVVAFLQAN